MGPSTNPGHGPRPLEATMNRRGLLALTTIVAHQTKHSLWRPARESVRGTAPPCPSTPRSARPSRNAASSVEGARRRRRSPSIRSRSGRREGGSPPSGRSSRASPTQPRREKPTHHHNRTGSAGTSAQSSRVGGGSSSPVGFPIYQPHRGASMRKKAIPRTTFLEKLGGGASPVGERPAAWS